MRCAQPGIYEVSPCVNPEVPVVKDPFSSGHCDSMTENVQTKINGALENKQKSVS